MARELVSKKTRGEFREFLVSWTLREIEMEFDAADVACDESFEPGVSGARRCLVEKYYKTVDWTRWDHVRRILAVFTSILIQLEHEATGESAFDGGKHARDRLAALKKWLERDGFEFRDGNLIPAHSVPHLVEVSTAASLLDSGELRRQIERIRESVDDDPALAIGTAKELVESTCKSILAARRVAFEDGEDLVPLCRKTRDALSLTPSGIAPTAKGAESIKRVLNNLATIAQGVGELRNLYGTGHGRREPARGLSGRHARLVVGAAATLATFLLETHEFRE